MTFNHIPAPDNAAEFDADQPGTLSYWATLLEDPTTEVVMSRPTGGSRAWAWRFDIRTPEGVKHSAAGTYQDR